MGSRQDTVKEAKRALTSVYPCNTYSSYTNNKKLFHQASESCELIYLSFKMAAGQTKAMLQ